jgi:hypothetical protein
MGEAFGSQPSWAPLRYLSMDDFSLTPDPGDLRGTALFLCVYATLSAAAGKAATSMRLVDYAEDLLRHAVTTAAAHPR